jgi:hypothetical protein
MGENEVLLKPVAQAIPKHVMYLFNIPKNGKGIMDAMSQLWWDDDVNEKNALVHGVEIMYS